MITQIFLGISYFLVSLIVFAFLVPYNTETGDTPPYIAMSLIWIAWIPIVILALPFLAIKWMRDVDR